MSNLKENHTLKHNADVIDYLLAISVDVHWDKKFRMTSTLLGYDATFSDRNPSAFRWQWLPLSSWFLAIYVHVPEGKLRFYVLFFCHLTHGVLHHILFTGRIVNMSSGLGRRCAPSRSSYCITKYGVEALSDCLRFEMRRWGVSVVIVEPGNFINGIHTLISYSVVSVGI
jgi:NAD(P)-dependent dehydrogenase (short-subunit alcohol dehydrogenase family)